MPELEVSRSKKLKASKMSTLRGGLAIKHIASHKCRISSFVKGKSSGSVPSRKPLHDRRRNSFNLLLHLLGKLLHKITHQLWNVFLTFPQRWYPDRKYMQAVVQITSEFAGCNHLFEIAIGRRDEPNIGSS